MDLVRFAKQEDEMGCHALENEKIAPGTKVTWKSHIILVQLEEEMILDVKQTIFRLYIRC